MRDCWMEAPNARPSFRDLVEDMGRILYVASGTVSTCLVVSVVIITIIE